MPKNSNQKVKKASMEKKVSKGKKKVATKVSTKVEEPVVAAVEPVVAAVEPVVTTESSEDNLTPYSQEFSDILGALDSTLVTVRLLKARVSKLEKQVHREHKLQLKKNKGRRRRPVDPNAQPSGFQKPGPVSDELRSFLGLGKEELIARTAVTKRINEYCKANNLQNPADKRQINPDTKLKKLLRVGKGQELTFFNLQTYMKVHFPNKEGVYPTA